MKNYVKSKNDLNYELSVATSEIINGRLKNKNYDDLFIYYSYESRENDKGDKEWFLILGESKKDIKVESDSLLVRFVFDKELNYFLPFNCVVGYCEDLVRYYEKLPDKKINDLEKIFYNNFLESKGNVSKRLFSLIDTSYIQMVKKHVKKVVKRYGRL